MAAFHAEAVLCMLNGRMQEAHVVFLWHFPCRKWAFCNLSLVFILSKYCPAGCLLPFAEISGTIPHGYRDVSWIQTDFAAVDTVILNSETLRMPPGCPKMNMTYVSLFFHICLTSIRVKLTHAKNVFCYSNLCFWDQNMFWERISILLMNNLEKFSFCYFVCCLLFQVFTIVYGWNPCRSSVKCAGWPNQHCD